MPVGGRPQATERLGINMKFLDAEFVQGFIRMANDGWEQGWHERNGGNLSYRVKPEEVEGVMERARKKIKAEEETIRRMKETGEILPRVIMKK